jgi:hypothetical protein
MMGLARKHPELVKVFKIGTTFENRPILILKLTDLPRKNTQKPLFLFESGIHAREWLSIASNTFFIDRVRRERLSANMVDSTDILVIQNVFYLIASAEVHG